MFIGSGDESTKIQTNHSIAQSKMKKTANNFIVFNGQDFMSNRTPVVSLIILLKSACQQ